MFQLPLSAQKLYCLSEDTIKIFAISNLKRLELNDKYNLALVEIKELKSNYNNFTYKLELADSIINNQYYIISTQNDLINAASKELNGKNKAIKNLKIITVVLLTLNIILLL